MDDLIEYILVQRDAVPKETIKKILKYSVPAKKMERAVFDYNTADDENNHWIVDHNFRKVQAVKKHSKAFTDMLIGMYKNLVLDLINPYYGFKIQGLEKPQVLCYGPGGHYKPHVDAEAMYTDPDGSIVWKKVMNRDLSTLLYLNDNFEGGDLVFPDFGIRIRPEPGLFVAFPSTHHFEHGVEPIVSGNRYTVVNWMTVEGFDRIEDRNRNSKTRMAGDEKSVE